MVKAEIKLSEIYNVLCLMQRSPALFEAIFFSEMLIRHRLLLVGPWDKLSSQSVRLTLYPTLLLFESIGT